MYEKANCVAWTIYLFLVCRTKFNSSLESREMMESHSLFYTAAADSSIVESRHVTHARIYAYTQNDQPKNIRSNERNKKLTNEKINSFFKKSDANSKNVCQRNYVSIFCAIFWMKNKIRQFFVSFVSRKK